ncbi:MAG TPA: hypothetical protein VFV08_05955, partial [Puia sp.]|nr:hypothetical protein [Puia sp.]
MNAIIRFSLSSLFLHIYILVSAQNGTQVAASLTPPVQMTANEDHARMMRLLGIDSIRIGADGMNPKAPNAANYDESRANPYPNLPDPLRLNNGKEIHSAQDWWKKRRPEIVEDFDREIIGRVPNNIPAVHWKVDSEYHQMIGSTEVVTKKLRGHVNNSFYPLINVDIELSLSTPANANGPVPVMMELIFKFPPGMKLPPQQGPSWQEQVLAKGWGFATYVPVSVQADNGAGLTQGIIGLVNKGQPRKLDDWGALRAWAWGASKVLDYFETDPAVDARQVGIEGHSRYGKAAL